MFKLKKHFKSPAKWMISYCCWDISYPTLSIATKGQYSFVIILRHSIKLILILLNNIWKKVLTFFDRMSGFKADNHNLGKSNQSVTVFLLLVFSVAHTHKSILMFSFQYLLLLFSINLYWMTVNHSSPSSHHHHLQMLLSVIRWNLFIKSWNVLISELLIHRLVPPAV